ncbi:MAG: type 4a pilus biogenesis protein PilO [Patescibacteria group bacterium]
MKISKSILKIKDSKYFALIPDFKREKTQKISSIVFSFFALSLLGIFAINPTLSTIAKLRKDLSDSKFVSQELQKKISNLQSLQQEYNLIENDIPLVLEAIPQNPQLPTLTGQLQALAAINNITVSNIQSFEVEAINNSPEKKDFSSFSFSVSGEGSYENIVSFVSSLVNIRRIIGLETFSIDRKSNTQNLVFNVKGKAYFKN